MLFCLLENYLDLYITDTALKVSRSLYCFTTSVSDGVETISPGCGVRASVKLFFFCLIFQFFFVISFHEARKIIDETICCTIS